MPTAGTAAQGATGEKLLQLARQHIGEKYVLGVTVPKNNPNWKGPFDCAEFASWLTYQTASILYGCNNDSAPPETADAFTGYWDRDANSVGKKVGIDEAARTPGAFVLRAPQPGAMGHIVVSDGNGGTVEAHSTGRGLIAFTLADRRWDTGILVRPIQYTPQQIVSVRAPRAKIYRLMQPPMAGPEVRDIQEALRNAGFDPGVVDSEYGPHTQAAVVAFQLSRGLVADGEVGTATGHALDL